MRNPCTISGMGSAPINTAAPASAKRPFAKRARDFAKAARALPGMPVLPALTGAAALIGTIAGAFDTDALPFAQRLAFWTILMGLQTAKWLVLLAWLVDAPRDYWKAAILGAVLLNPFIPFEVWLSYRLVGTPATLAHGPVLGAVVVIAAAILAVMALVHPPRWWPRRARTARGLLASRNLVAAEVLAASAEDHYCRLYLADGRQLLTAGRFADLLHELAEADGMQIHRGRWVSDAGVRASRRAGRGWEVLLPCGTAMRVSATYRAGARARGWLDRREKPASPRA